jgi:hypothetical protein
MFDLALVIKSYQIIKKSQMSFAQWNAQLTFALR